MSNNLTNLLIIDGTKKGERFVIKYNGVSVALTAKSFKYLTKLAFSRTNSENSGWIHKTDIEPGYNQARYLYRLKTELKKSLGKDNIPEIENVRNGKYRLKIKPERIGFKLENLISHEDFEISSLFDKEHLLYLRKITKTVN